MPHSLKNEHYKRVRHEKGWQPLCFPNYRPYSRSSPNLQFLPIADALNILHSFFIILLEKKIVIRETSNMNLFHPLVQQGFECIYIRPFLG